MTTQSSNEQLVRDYFACLAAGDIDRFISLFAPEGRVYFAAGTSGETRLFWDLDGLRESLQMDLGKLYDPTYGIHPDILFMVSQGDKIAAEIRIRGRTSTGGLPYDNIYAHFFWFRDGKIVEVHEHLDTSYVRERLFGPNGMAGATEMPGYNQERTESWREPAVSK
jgi:ketosteroid isomerase-like protein